MWSSVRASSHSPSLKMIVSHMNILVVQCFRFQFHEICLNCYAKWYMWPIICISEVICSIVTHIMSYSCLLYIVFLACILFSREYETGV